MSRLIPWNDPFDDFDRFFNDRLPATVQGITTDTSLDMYEEDGDVVVELAVPGMQGDDLSVSVKDGYLTISGEREEKKEEEDKERRYFMRQIQRGSFARSVRLPAPVDTEAIKAVCKGGVLKVTLPKIEPKDDSVKIEIKNEE